MIPIAEHCGLCFGAQKSIDTVLDALREADGRPVILYKEILHNAVVMDDLAARGARRVDSLDDIPDDAFVVVRAHGEGKEFYDRAARREFVLRDATCANVRKIHKLVRDADADGKFVVIFGKRGHAETEGANGWCNGGAAIIESEDDVAALAEPAAARILAVCQTTASREKAERLLALLRERFPEKDLEFKDTVCGAPLRIHEPSMRLAGECDILFTIGGAKSSNTAELRRKCESVGGALCPPPVESCAAFGVFLREHPEMVRPGIRHGFTAGASTPLAEVEKCRDLLAFRIHYAEAKARLERKMESVNRTFAAGGVGGDNRILREAGGHFAAVNAGGKYLRGVLAGIGFSIVDNGADNGVAGGAEEFADDLSLAFEVFQTAVLIHDDLIDHASARRGRATVPARYRESYAGRAGGAQQYSRDGAAEAGDAMAVCVGDWGLFASVDILARAYGDSPRFAELLRMFAGSVLQTIQGEIIDTVLPFEERAGIGRGDGNALLDSVRDIHLRKTAWYTAIGPLLCGMILGGAPESDRAIMREFAENLGIAFQIQDDDFGVFGDAAALGKDVGSDVAEYKQTLLYAFVRVLRPDLFARLRSLYGNADALEEVRDLFVASGARGAALREMRGRFAAALSALDRASFLSREQQSLLRGFLLHLSLRDN